MLLTELERHLGALRNECFPGYLDNTQVGIEYDEELDEPVLVFRNPDFGGWETTLDLGRLPAMEELDPGPERHFLVSGRAPSGNEETMAHVIVYGDEDPEHAFVEQYLYASDELPEDWKTHPPGAWYTIKGCVEIPGPPIT